MWHEIHEGPAPDGFGYILETKENDVGYRSITLPGTVAGLGEIHKRYGKMPWSEILAGPTELARRGFLVSPPMAAFWRRPGLFGRVSTRERLGYTDAGRKIWLPEGEPPEAGEVKSQELLAQTYERLAKYGPEDYYTGALSEEIGNDFEKNGALITKADLAAYRCLWQEPIQGRFLGHDILSTPLPGGGVALIQALRLSEMYGLLNLAHNSPDYVNLLAHILSAVQSDRLNHQSDPEFPGGPNPQELIKESYLRAMVTENTKAHSLDPQDTTELTVVDQWGNAIVFCHSLGYGSGVFTEGLGFMYNNCMSGFDPTPNLPSSIAPGKARSTAIAQTLVRENGRPKVILGSPGGSHITAGLTQALLNFLGFGFDLQDAVCRPRLDAYSGTLLLESRMPFRLEDALLGKWKFNRSPSPYGMVGRIYAIAFTDEGLKPGYDPGEPSTVREF
jgi:gamma-glutamyltranspeptidase/glutathione hydrolase